MLQEVRCAVRLICLRAATGIDPNTNSRSLSPWRVLSGDLENVQFVSLYKSASRRNTVSSGPEVVTYRQSVCQRRALRLGQIDGRRKIPSHRVDRSESSLAPESGVQARGQAARCHFATRTYEKEENGGRGREKKWRYREGRLRGG